MKLILPFVSLILITLSCTRNELRYDEIQLTAITDTSYIEIIIEPDSIIFYEIERRNCDGWGNCEVGPGYRCRSIKDSTQLNAYQMDLKIILSDTFKPNRLWITDASTNHLVILSNDSILKEFRYFDVKDENEILRRLGHLIFKTIEMGVSHDISYNHKLFDLSPIKNVDSIRISNTKLHIPPYDSLKRIAYYIKNHNIRTIKNNDTISKILNEIPKLRIIKSPQLEDTNKMNFYPKYELELFKNGLIKYIMYMDERLLSYNQVQCLEVDSLLINYIK